MASSQDGNIGIWSGYTPGDNGWTAQHNSNWDALDALVQATVKNNTLTTPPGSPATGDAYIVPAGATGAWSSQTNKIAVWQGRTGVAAWQFYTPKNGWQVYNQIDGGDYLYNGSAWILQGSQRLNVPTDYISGLKLVWNSATSISAGTGSAYIPSLARLSQVNSTLTLSSLSLSASTWYHIYLFESAGTPTLECVTTAPTSYQGTASQKTGDNSRRYLGSALTDSSGNIYNFVHVPSAGRIIYQTSVFNAPFNILSAGMATTATNVSCSTVVPSTSRFVWVSATNNDTSVTVLIGNSNSPPAATPAWMDQMRANMSGSMDILLDASQAFQYMFVAAPAASFIVRVKGYTFDR